MSGINTRSAAQKPSDGAARSTRSKASSDTLPVLPLPGRRKNSSSGGKKSSLPLQSENDFNPGEVSPERHKPPQVLGVRRLLVVNMRWAETPLTPPLLPFAQISLGIAPIGVPGLGEVISLQEVLHQVVSLLHVGLSNTVYITFNYISTTSNQEALDYFHSSATRYSYAALEGQLAGNQPSASGNSLSDARLWNSSLYAKLGPGHEQIYLELRQNLPTKQLPIATITNYIQPPSPEAGPDLTTGNEQVETNISSFTSPVLDRPAPSPSVKAPTPAPLSPIHDLVSYHLQKPNGTWKEVIIRPKVLERGSGDDGLASAYAWKHTGRRQGRTLSGRSKVPLLRKSCAGLLKCEKAECTGVARPKVHKTKADESEANAARCHLCGSNLVLISCTARWIVADGLKQGEVECWHENFHSHQLPPVRSIPKAAQIQLQQLSNSHPELKPTQLRQGNATDDTSNPSYRPPATSIHPKFGSTRVIRDTLSSERASEPGSSLLEAKLKEITIQDIAKINRNGVILTLVNPPLEAPEASIICLQSPTMARWLKRELGGSTEAVEALGGVLTDAHNTFFSRPFVLIASVVFNDQMARWVPVQYTIANREIAEVYEIHFRRILDTLSAGTSSIDEILRQAMAVLDFSASQLKGFEKAFGAWYVELRKRDRSQSQNPADLYKEGIMHSQQARKGCLRHFQASVYRCAKSKLVDPDKEESFIAQVEKWRKSSTKQAAARAYQQLVQDFPGAQEWLKWWRADRVASMILQSQQSLSSLNAKSLPSTTNAVESSHNLLIISSGGEKNSLKPGLQLILDHIRMHEALEQSALDGYATGRQKPRQPSQLNKSSRTPEITQDSTNQGANEGVKRPASLRSELKKIPTSFVNDGAPPTSIYQTTKNTNPPSRTRQSKKKSVQKQDHPPPPGAAFKRSKLKRSAGALSPVSTLSNIEEEDVGPVLPSPKTTGLASISTSAFYKESASAPPPPPLPASANPDDDTSDGTEEVEEYLSSTKSVTPINQWKRSAANPESVLQMRWSGNSCWLDSQIVVLAALRYWSVAKFPAERLRFSVAATITDHSFAGIGRLLDAAVDSLIGDGNPTEARDALRQQLAKEKIIALVTGFHNPSAWFDRFWSAAATALDADGNYLLPDDALAVRNCRNQKLEFCAARHGCVYTYSPYHSYMKTGDYGIIRQIGGHVPVLDAQDLFDTLLQPASQKFRRPCGIATCPYSATSTTFTTFLPFQLSLLNDIRDTVNAIRHLKPSEHLTLNLGEHTYTWTLVATLFYNKAGSHFTAAAKTAENSFHFFDEFHQRGPARPISKEVWIVVATISIRSPTIHIEADISFNPRQARFLFNGVRRWYIANGTHCIVHHKRLKLKPLLHRTHNDTNYASFTCQASLHFALLRRIKTLPITLIGQLNS